MVEIDYVEMAEFFMDIINDISKKQNEITGWKWRETQKPSDKLLKAAKKDYYDAYASFDRAYYRARDVIDLIEFKDESDFASFALANLNNTKSRIEHFLEKALLEYPDYQLNRYDSILKDYYSKMDYCDGAVSKYTNIHYLRTNVNLAICHNIDHQYTLLAKKHFDDVRSENYAILDEIVKLVKQLYGFKAPEDKSHNFISYERWSDAEEVL